MGGDFRTIPKTFRGSYVGLDGIKIGLEIFSKGMSIILVTARASL